MTALTPVRDIIQRFTQELTTAGYNVEDMTINLPLPVLLALWNEMTLMTRTLISKPEMENSNATDLSKGAAEIVLHTSGNMIHVRGPA